MRLKRNVLLIILIIITVLIPTSAFADPDLPTGLVGLWTFEEGSGTAVNDVSGVAPAMNLAIEDSTHTTWSPAGALTMGGTVTEATILGEGVGDSDGVLDSLAAGKIAAAMRATNEFTIEAWVTATGTTVSGPARVVNLTDPAAPTGNRNFSLLQDTTIWDFRLRHSTSGTSPGDWNPVGTAVSAGTPVLLVVTYDASGGAGTGVGIMYVIDPSSCPVTPTGHTETTTGGNLSNWSDDYRFSMGNETSFPTSEVARDWRGEFHMVALYNQALTPAEIATRCTEGSRQIFDPLTISKAFSPASVEPGEPSTLTFTIDNPAGNPATGGVGFTDNLPGGLQVATTPNVTNTCGGTFAPASPDTILTLTGGSIAAGVSSCTLSVDVVAASANTYNNTSGVVSSIQTPDSALGASDTLTVAASALTLTKVYSPLSILSDGIASTTLTFTLGNPNTVVSASNVSFSDTLDADLALTNLQNTCGGTPDLTGQTVSLTGATLAAGNNCAVSVDVTSTVPGAYPNGPVVATSGTIPSSIGASATLNVVNSLSFSKEFTNDPVEAGDTATLEFTIDNLDPNLATSGIAFTDVLPAGLTFVAGTLPNPVCGGGTLALSAGDTTLDLTGGALAASGQCTFTVDVLVGAVAAGAYTNTTNNISGTTGGFPVVDGQASDDLFVSAAPSVSKVFSPNTIGHLSTATLKLKVDNSANPAPIIDLDISDTLPGSLEFEGGLLSDTCGGTPTIGTSTLTYQNGTVAANSTCLITIKVRAQGEGSFLNTATFDTDFGSSVFFSQEASANLKTIAYDVDLELTIQGSGLVTQTGIDWGFDVCNEGNEPTGGLDVRFDLDPALSFVSSTPAGTLEGQTLWVALDSIPTNECKHVDIRSVLKGATEALLDTARVKLATVDQKVASRQAQVSQVCVTGSVANVADTACVAVDNVPQSPATLPSLGGQPVAGIPVWAIVVLVGLLAIGVTTGFVLKKRSV